MIVEKAYAKVNLSLEVLDTREDGFHPVNTIMVPVDLYDELTFSPSDEIIYRPSYDIEDDIVIKALRLFYNKYKITKGVCITLEKGIPIQAGLAGGSSDAAATLRGLDKLFGINAELSELEDLANMLGSDVAYCLYQSASYCTGRGEIVQPIYKDYKKWDITLIKPDFGISTKAIYDAYVWDKTSHEEQTKMIIEALENNDLDKLKKNIYNDLASISIFKTPLYDIYKDVKELGYDVFLSGSGPTLFILGEKPNLDSIKKKYEGISILNTKLL
ncbi:MAG: 4-(cytidine 5'-diphospho)-2-C-methyl-D-erythritol kinase [Anaeroplasmataceae bacterium]